MTRSRVLLATCALAACSTEPSPAPSTAPTPPSTVVRAELWVSPQGRDSAPGTAARPLRQVRRAALLARPGTLVHVADGDYATVTSSVSGTATAPVVFQAEERGAAKIAAGGATTAWTNIGDWVVIDGFDLSGSTYNGILSTASHGRFVGNHVHDIRGPDCTRGGAGIVMETYTATDNVTAENVVERVIAPGDCAKVHGIYYQSANGGQVVNNLVSACSGWGIHLWHNASAILITNNTVVGNTHGGIAVGGSLEGNDVAPGIASGVVVTNNLVVDNGQVGISELGRVGANTYAANLSSGNGVADYRLEHGGPAGDLVSGDPAFVDPVRDYHLREGSPALDQGSAAGAPDTDLEGSRRPQGAAVDIGAYEGAY